MRNVCWLNCWLLVDWDFFGASSTRVLLHIGVPITILVFLRYWGMNAFWFDRRNFRMAGVIGCLHTDRRRLIP